MDLDRFIIEMTYNFGRLLLQKGTAKEVKEWINFIKMGKRRKK